MTLYNFETDSESVIISSGHLCRRKARSFQSRSVINFNFTFFFVRRAFFCLTRRLKLVSFPYYIIFYVYKAGWKKVAG